ncbi:hypothetical protein F2Q70_00008547 [Brassica cretica]|uniref:Uncharacterized protein n=1 Tax=Brassica cretica TaxID=69181 RepID=A0A8S9ME19_BRACR|nr:hypothetical protein F2Q68_00001595 [Brassica cretica]KAF2615476.1 hypothetical protein F2Q70_00008547 [Brassica cretica]
MVGESSNHNHNVNINVSSHSMIPGNCDSYYDIEQEQMTLTTTIIVSIIIIITMQNTEMGETESNSYVSSYMNGESFHSFPPPLVISPESFNKQMMMAMDVSLAEVHATTTSAPAEVTRQ